MRAGSFESYHAITTLMYRYAECIDATDFAGLAGAGAEALPRTVVIKLNGGLGTSMGMTRAKSLLTVKDGLTFLDVIARQMVRLRERHGVAVPLVLMDSFRTQADSLAVLARYGRLSGPLAPDFLQHKVPRIAADGLVPVAWPQQPEHEWCPAAEALSELWTGKIGVADCHSPLWPLRHVLLSRRVGRLFERLVSTKPSPV